MKQNTESTFKGVVKTLQSLSQRLLRSANNMENIILVYCFVRRLFHTFSFSLLMNQHTGLLTPAASFTFSILFTYLYMYYLCKIVSTYAFFIVYSAKINENGCFVGISFPQFYSYSLMNLLLQKMG